MDEARKLLDSLMGSHRNVDRKEAKARKGQNFKEDNICKLYLLGFCPQYEDLFHSTKRDIGKCNKVHSEAMKLEFEAHPERERYMFEYERQLRNYLEDLVRGADEWVARERRNIQAANQQIEESGPNEIAKAEIKKLNDQAAALFMEAENLAEAGNFDESKVKLELAEEVKKRASDWEEKARTVRTEDVCEVCGSRMESGDPSKAKFRHEDGKIHAGYVKIRRWLMEIRQKLREREERGDIEDTKRTDREVREREPRDKERRRSRSTGKVEGSRRDAEREREKDRQRPRGRERERGGSYEYENDTEYERFMETDCGRDDDRCDRGRESDRGREVDRGLEGDRGADLDRARIRERTRYRDCDRVRGRCRDSRERGHPARCDGGRDYSRASESVHYGLERSRGRGGCDRAAECDGSRGRDRSHHYLEGYDRSRAYERAYGYGYGHAYDRMCDRSHPRTRDREIDRWYQP